MTSTTPANQTVSPLAPSPERVEGRRCPACRRVTALALLRCPRCGARSEPASFGPSGTVWSSTVVRLDGMGHAAPYALAYLDLDEGPRVLVHVRGGGDGPVAIGARLRLAGRTDDGDPIAEPA